MRRYRDNKIPRREAVASNLYYNFRYRQGSYKARKSALREKLMEVKVTDTSERLILYVDEGQTVPVAKPIQITALKGKLTAWKQVDRARYLLEHKSNGKKRACLVTQSPSLYVA